MKTSSFEKVRSDKPAQTNFVLHQHIHYLWSLLILLTIVHHSSAQSFPESFSSVQMASGLDPVGMAIAPDGRVFINEKPGKIRIVKDGVLLPAPFITIPNVESYNEQGLQDIELDPDFSNNNYVYVYYTYREPGSTERNNRVSRFTADGDVAVSGSELVLLDIDPLESGTVHNGGSLAFKDGKLLVSVGENGERSNSQSFTTLKGKLLRINSDGSIPADNPFYESATGYNRAIWALGFRNPFNIAVQPGTGAVLVNDVGENSYEEINLTDAGKNYGWPGIEGPRMSQPAPTNYQDPLYAYTHSLGCSITGGDFYGSSTNPYSGQYAFPLEYLGKYFFTDYCNGWIKTIDPITKVVTTFATGLNRPVALRIGPDGSLYCIARGGIGGGSDADNTSSNAGVLWKITYTGSGFPALAVQPFSKTVSIGNSVTFSVLASGSPTLTYQWQRNGVDIPGATEANYMLTNTALSDNGAVFKVIVSNAVGSVVSNEATLTVLENLNPIATIITPTISTTYKAGDEIHFSGSGTDPEDGELPISALSWKVDFYHYDSPAHFHPVIAPVSGITSGSFTIPVSGEVSPNVLYRIYLTVTDSKGATTTTSVDVNPVRSVITLVTQPVGLPIKFDGVVVNTPYTFTGVSGVVRELDVENQSKDGVTYLFHSWSDGGAASHLLSTPGSSATVIANFMRQADTIDGLTAGLSYTYVEGSYNFIPDFTTLTPVKTGITPTFDIDSRNRDDNFAFQFRGYLDIPTDGQYVFYTQSDDGSRLSIGDIIVVDNDGLHGSIEKSGAVYLQAGKHPIEVTYFELDGDQSLIVSYEGPGATKQLVPASMIFSPAPVSDLTAVLYARPSSANGLTTLSVVVDVYELLGVATTGPIAVRITKDAKVNLNLVPMATFVGGRSVNNNVWNISGPVGGFYTLTTNQIIEANGSISFGLEGTLSPNMTTGVMSISTVIVSGSGGEIISDNNSNSDKIDYFQQ